MFENEGYFFDLFDECDYLNDFLLNKVDWFVFLFNNNSILFNNLDLVLNVGDVVHDVYFLNSYSLLDLGYYLFNKLRNWQDVYSFVGNCDGKIFLQDDGNWNFDRVNDHIVCLNHFHVIDVHVLDSVSVTINRYLRFLSNYSFFCDLYRHFNSADFSVFSQNLFNHSFLRFHCNINDSFNGYFHNLLNKAGLLYYALDWWHLLGNFNEFLNNFLNYLWHFHYLFNNPWHNNDFLNYFLDFDALWHLDYFFNNLLNDLHFCSHSIIVDWERH